VLLFGFLIFFGTIVNDILFARQIITSIFLVPLGMFFFIFSQAYLLSLRFSRAFVRTEELGFELTFLNNNLELLVKQRTAELEQQKEEIEAQSEYLREANEKVGLQRDILEKTNKEIGDSIKVASRIQQALLPSNLLFEQHLNDYFVLLKPRNVVSGDFYWANFERNHLLIAAGDCTGHGVPGAFVSLLGISLLNEIVRSSKISSASEVLEELRSKVKSSLQQDNINANSREGMDLAFIALDINSNMLRYAGANTPVYIVRAGKLIMLEPVKNPISIYRREKLFMETTMQMQKGDCIYMFSDGYYDQINPKNVKFKRTKFKELICSVAHLPMKEQKQIFDHTIENWKDSKQQVDDILVLGLKI
jgi:serine phosphatase RsbU (regulator of sigma subunit)